jgi:predicted nucleic acid-binding protein
MLELEISGIREDAVRKSIMDYYRNTITAETPLTEAVEKRAAALQMPNGLRRNDAYHVALAESAGVTYLLTTDPKFINAAARMGVKAKVINPINFLQEYYKWLQL